MVKMMDKCQKCGEYIKKGQLCLDCSKNSLEAHLKRQINDKQTKVDVPIGDLLAKETAGIISNMLNENSFISQIDLKARGRHITRAIDVSEILKRELTIKPKMKTNTSEFKNNENKPVKVSEICISFKVGGK